MVGDCSRLLGVEVMVAKAKDRTDAKKGLGKHVYIIPLETIEKIFLVSSASKFFV